MPLNADAVQIIRKNLEIVAKGLKPKAAIIGILTGVQLKEINDHRRNRNLDPIEAEIVFVGRHIHESRVVRDGYNVDDVIQQIYNGMHSESKLLITPKMTVLQNPARRDDGYGNLVNDQIVLECTSKYPRPELFSTIPKGDQNKPIRQKKSEGAAMTATPK